KNGNISVRFNEFIAKSSDLKFKINDKPADIVAFDGAKGNKVILDGSEVTGGKPITVKALEVIDIVGNKTPLTQLAVSQPLRKNDVVINEIMFAPIRNSDSGMNQSEYVELYNRRDYAISLEGISLHKAPDSRGNIYRLSPESTHLKWIPAHGTAIIYADKNAVFNQTDRS